MSIAYAQKNKNAVQTKRESSVSIIDTSSQNKSLQRKADLANNAAQRASAPRPNNTGMPDNLKSGIENLSGFSMDDVRVHYNSSKPATVQALAYTQGADIHVAPGQEKHLPHEAWHVAQQMAGRVSPTTNINGMPVNDNAALEHEADVMGEKAVQCKVADKPSSFKHVNIFKRSVQCCGGGGTAGESQETNSSNHSSSSEDLDFDVCGLFGSEPKNDVGQETDNADQTGTESQGTDKTELTEKQECDAITSASKALLYEEKLTAFKEKHRDSIDALMKIRITVQDLYLNIIFLELNNPNITENDQQIKDFTKKRNKSLAEFKEKFEKIETDYHDLCSLWPYGQLDEFLQELKKLQFFYNDIRYVDDKISSDTRMADEDAEKYFKNLKRLPNPAKGVGEDCIRDKENRSVLIGRDHVIPYESLRDYVCLMYEEWDSGKEWYPAAVKWFENALKTYFKNNPGVESLDELVRLKCLAKDKSYNLFLEDCVQKALLWMPGNIFLSWKVYESVSGNELSSENVDRLGDDHDGTAIDSYSFKNCGDQRVAAVSGEDILDMIQAKKLDNDVFENLAKIADELLFETKPEEWETLNEKDDDGKYRSYYNPQRLVNKMENALAKKWAYYKWENSGGGLRLKKYDEENYYEALENVRQELDKRAKEKAYYESLKDDKQRYFEARETALKDMCKKENTKEISEDALAKKWAYYKWENSGGGLRLKKYDEENYYEALENVRQELDKRAKELAYYESLKDDKQRYFEARKVALIEMCKKEGVGDEYVFSLLLNKGY